MKDKFFDEDCVKRADEISSLVTEDNYKEILKDLNDGLGTVLANTAITIAEQKKLLQNAKTPSALASAIKAIAVTSGNLFHAGSSMLSWMGKKLPQRDSISDMKSVLKLSDNKNSYEILRDNSDKLAVACNLNRETGLCDSIQCGFTTVEDALQAVYKTVKEAN